MSRSADATVRVVAAAIAAETGMIADDITSGTRLRDLGIESVLSVGVVERLEADYGPLSKALLLEFATVGELAAQLQSLSTDTALAPEGDTAAVQLTQPLVVETIPVPAVTAPTAPTPPAVPTASGATGAVSPGIVPAVFATASEPVVPEHAVPELAVTEPAVPRPAASTAVPERDTDPDDDAIAIVGMAGQFPQAADIDTFWQNLVKGRDNIEVIPERIWDWREFWNDRPGVAGTSYSKWGGFIPDHRLFDPDFFRISRLEAQSIDPQERVFLETVYHALEHAQYPKAKRAEVQIGLFVAVMWGSYQHYGSMTAEAGASYATIANRASFALGLTGPSIPIDTMCSGSLTTLHMGAQSIRNRECEMAVVGGVNLTTHPNKYFVLSRTGFAAKDGRCKPFAAGADGYVPSEGSGALVLKRLSAATRDGDRVLAVLRHSAVNHGGLVNNLTMPNVEAQASLIEGTFAATGISPDSIDYVEAHAPGTELGDPIEIRALTSTFTRHGVGRTDIPIGSVKSNVGHLESAAGVASVVKVIEQMRHRRLVPSIHAETVNPNIDFDAGPLALQVESTPWIPRTNQAEEVQPYLAMINCFGAGGTNAHVLIEAGPNRSVAPVPGPQDRELFLFSARTAHALDALLHAHRQLLERFFTRADSEAAISVADSVTSAVARVADLAPRHVRQGDLLSDLLPAEERFAALPAELARATAVHLSTAELDRESSVAELIEWVQYLAVPDCLPRTADAESAWFQSLARATQTGRDMMQHRLAIVATDVKDLAATIDTLLSDRDVRGELDGCFTGHATPAEAVTLRRELTGEYIDQLLGNRRLDRVGEYWAQGLDIDWTGNFPPAPLHVDLPLYPFDHVVCWAPQDRPERAWAGQRPAALALAVDLDQSLATEKVHMSLALEDDGSHSTQVSTLAHMVTVAVPQGDTPFVAKLEPTRDLRHAVADGFPPDAVAIEAGELGSRVVRCLSHDTTLAQISITPSSAQLRPVSSIGPELRQHSLPLAPSLDQAGGAGGTATDNVSAARFSLAREDDLASLLGTVLACVSTASGQDAVEPMLVGQMIRHAALPKTGSILITRRSAEDYEAMVVDDGGTPILTCMRILQPASDREQFLDGPPLRVFNDTWHPYEPPASEATPPARVLVVAPSEETADHIAAAPRFATAATQQILLNHAGVSHLRRDGRWEIRLDDFAALSACLRLVDDPDVIVFASAGHAGTSVGELTALHLLAQEAIRRNLFRRGGLRFAVVTRGAVSLPGEAPTPSGLGGYVRTLTREATWPIAHLDLEPSCEISVEQAAVVARIAEWPDHDRPFALRDGQFWREALNETALPMASIPPFRQGGHYVLFGGNGTIGRQLGLELARRYRARMTWVSRGELSEEANAAVGAIRELGGDVRHIRADVTDLDAVRRACTEARDAFGPIHGLMHMTMTRNIRRIVDLKPVDFAGLLTGKVDGTEAVVQVGREEAADFTLLYSSIDVHVGSVGWSAYTAGCSYQMAVAARAQAEGEPVQAIGWGFWEGIEDSVATTLGEKGIGLITPAQGLAAMQAVLSTPNAPTVVAVAEDAALKKMGFTIAAAGPSPVVEQAGATASPAVPTPTPAESTPTTDVASPQPRPIAHEFPTGVPPATEVPNSDVLDGLTTLFAEILKTDADALDPDSDLLNYGVDSLIVVNIQATMEERLGAVPTALLLENSTLRQIAQVVERDHKDVAHALRGGAGAGAGDRTAAASAPPPQPSATDTVDVGHPAGAGDESPTSEKPSAVRILRQVAADGIDAFLRAYPSLYDEDMLTHALAPALGPSEQAGALTHGMVGVDGANIEFFAVGEGEPIVVFSAVALTVPVWTHVMTSALTRDHRLIVVHQPGYGLSEAITGCGNRETARVALDAVRGLGEPGPYHLLASCLGSVAAMHFAADFPDETASLALIGAFHDASDLDGGDPSTMTSGEFQQLAETAVATLHRDFDAVAAAEAATSGQDLDTEAHIEDSRQLLLSSQKVNFLVALRYLNEMMSGSLIPVLEQIEARTLCLYGDADQIISPRHSGEITSLLSSAQSSRIDGSGHFPYLTHPSDFLSRYTAFLAGDDVGTASQPASGAAK